MRIIQTVIQLAPSQCAEKCSVIFESISNGAPNYLWFCVILRECRDQNVEGVSNSAALVMDDVIVAAYRFPNEAFAWESCIRDDVSRLPRLARLCQLTIVAGTKCDNGGRQITGGVNLMKAPGILQHSAILSRELRDICAAEALNRESEE